jgi:hypothetical protein
MLRKCKPKNELLFAAGQFVTNETVAREQNPDVIQVIIFNILSIHNGGIKVEVTFGLGVGRRTERSPRSKPPNGRAFPFLAAPLRIDQTILPFRE